MDKTDLEQAYKEFLAAKPDERTVALQEVVANAIKQGFAPFLVTSYGINVLIEDDTGTWFDEKYLVSVEVRRLNYRFRGLISRNDIWDSNFYNTWYKLGEDLKHQIRYRAGLDVPANIERGEN